MKGLPLVWLMLAGLVVAGCGRPLSDATLSRYSYAKKRVDSVQREVANIDDRLERAAKLPVYPKFIQRFAEAEKWSDKIEAAYQLIRRAGEVVERAKPIVERNKEQDEAALGSLLTESESLIRQARETAQVPLIRLEAYVRAADSGPAFVSESRKRTQAQLRELDQLIASTKASAKRHPAKKEDLARRTAPFVQTRQELVSGLKAAEQQLGKKDPDLSRIVSYALLTKEINLPQNEAFRDLNSRVLQLDRSYTKTLVDMKAEYLVWIERTSWDDWSDSADVVEVLGPYIVDELTYLRFAELEATEADISEEVAGTLIGSTRAGMSGSSCSFAVDNVEERYFHTYRITNGNDVRAGNWEPVSEQVFEEYAGALGMDILSKPYGLYEDESYAVPTPPGMSLVGYPEYGTWQGSGGSRVWMWRSDYLYFADLIDVDGGRFYRYDEWNVWRRDYRGRKPYYGKFPDRPSYGSFAQGTRTRLAGSTWSRTGGFKTQDASVRGAGPARRGGGPGGGGK